MELKLNFNGRTLLLAALAAACLYGLYSGASLLSAAHDLQRETALLQQRIEKVKAGKTDLNPTEMLEIAAVGMQEQMNPGFLKGVEVAADDNVARGYLLFAGSVVASLVLAAYYWKSAPSRVPEQGA